MNSCDHHWYLWAYQPCSSRIASIAYQIFDALKSTDSGNHFFIDCALLPTRRGKECHDVLSSFLQLLKVLVAFIEAALDNGDFCTASIGPGDDDNSRLCALRGVQERIGGGHREEHLAVPMSYTTDGLVRFVPSIVANAIITRVQSFVDIVSHARLEKISS